MTREEFVEFEKLVRINRIYMFDSEYELCEVFRVELFENGKFGTWVRTYAKNYRGSCSLERYKLSDFQILKPIIVSINKEKGNEV